MAFDTATRTRLSDFVADARRVLTEEFAEQLQSLYGISITGDIAPLDRLTHLDAEGLELAATLRQRIVYLTSSSPEARDAAKAAVDRLTREQAFTVLNRLAAIRMAEKRGLIVESVGQQYQSKGFKVFESVAGSAIGETYDRYRCYLFCLFDELAIDLGSLFDRRSPQALLFPRETSLLALLDLLDESDLQDLWAEDETIGWIYQYYNDPAERKKMRKESAAPRNSRELAVRNQFFTPRYVVEFLTDNTLGRIWYEMTQAATALTEHCCYLVRRPTEIFLKPGESAPEQSKQDGLSQEDLLKQPVFIPHRPLKDPRSILMLDPACGSMHFGLYAFDLFEAIYKEAWEIATGSDEAAKAGELFAPFCAFAASFSDKAAFQREVPRMIVEHNLHGIDIDPRAAQIAGLSLWLRAQRAWSDAGVKPVDRPRITRSNIVCAEPMPGDKVLLAEFVEQQFSEGERAAFRFLLETVFDRMTLAGEAGSLLKIEEEIRTAIAEAKKLWEKEPQQTQRMLFGGGEDKPGNTQKKLDLSGITNEQFWAGAEDRIYAALSDYAEQAETGGLQRRLFADDAARGFAFIDVCRRRYDVVLMNPPFGEPSTILLDQLEHNFSDINKNLLCAFLKQGFAMLLERGRLGAIYDRTALVKTTYEAFRRSFLTCDSRLEAQADLGWQVLDANVEVTASILCRDKRERLASFCDARKAEPENKGGVVLQVIEDMRLGISPLALKLINGTAFQRFPNAVLGYDFPAFAVRLFSELPNLEERGVQVLAGHTILADRFFRYWWEVPLQDAFRPSSSWQRLYNGGDYCRFTSALCDAVLYGSNGELIAANQSTILRNPKLQQSGKIGFGKRGDFIDAHVLPGGFVSTVEGQAVVFHRDAQPFAILALLNGRLFQAVVNLYCGQHKYPGYVHLFPCPEWSSEQLAEAGRAARMAFEAKEAIESADETHAKFLQRSSLKPWDSAWLSRIAEAAHAVALAEREVNGWIANAYHLDERAKEFVTEANKKEPATGGWLDEEPLLFQTQCIIHFALGATLGRWDIRYATGEQAALELPDPFAALPVCPPGQLQNAQGLPAGPQDVPAGYAVKNIPWDGILVDDPGHPRDIERRVREVIEIIWIGKDSSSAAEAIEQQACEVLGVDSLRDYFRKPAGFFAAHLKRYSKSRRQAPIYWPISTKSGSYTLWIYYHRLNDQTLHKCIADFLDPKIKDVESELGKLYGKDSGRAADLRDFLTELKDLRDEIERVIKLPWKPNLNDGVLITACPLWKLFRLSKWQKNLRACWEKLEKGDCDWAHLAYSIWPERVEKACEKDRSIAIAHGLEHLCKVEPPKPKKPRGKKASS